MVFTTSRCRRSCNILCILSLLFFLVYKDGIFQNPFSDKSLLKSSKMMQSSEESTICTEMHEHKGYDSECEYLKANPDCNSGGFLNYMVFFYCNCGEIKPLGYLVLIIWLAVLFYLLGNTASDYFCCCLEMLSDKLRMPPTVAGVTLLPLGNGAPDVFSSIAAFVGRDSGDVGLNSVLGGSVFITCIVAGAISLCVANKNVAIDKKCFIRDVGVFIITLGSLLIILFVGEVSVGGAITFISIYVVYVGFVVVNEILNKYKRRSGFARALLPVVGNAEDDEFEHPLLESVPKLKVPHCLWNESVKSTNDDEGPTYLWGWNEDEDEENAGSDRPCCSWSRLCSLLEMPLAIPRRLTIPVVEQRRWSKAYAVASAFLSPILLALLCSSGDNGHIALYIGAALGVTLGLLALLLTRGDHPPRKFLFPWVMGGFLMSIVWFYIIANELVALLVDLGIIMSVRTSLLGLTILAWGNSMGDLMANVAIAINGGDGVQLAMSGCYAGPTFNTLVGLGISLLLGAWSERPNSYILPVDSSLYLTLGFLTLGLIWSLVILPRNDMRPSKLLGIGLMVIYLGFLSFRVSIEMSGSIT